MNKELILKNPTLPLKGIKSYLFQILFVTIAVILPTIAHLSGAPVRFLLPMHWAIILAGLVYGWRGGLISGLLAPIVSYMISGMPMPGILLQMTAELAAYGAIAGLMRENLRLNIFAATALALAAGRFVFIVMVFSMGSYSGAFTEYLKAAMLPGLIAGALQIAILPFIAKWWINKEQQ
jgi:membrane-associated HD superfamily phosphohydrolase